MSKMLVISKEEIEKWQDILSKYYSDAGLDEEEIEEKISNVLQECQTGWNRAPKDFDTRVKMKSGFQWKSHDNLKPKKKKEEIIEETDDSEENIFDMMSIKEKEWWDKRKSQYEDDFEFNNSSDQPLLLQLLSEELMQNRIIRAQLRDRSKDYSKKLNSSVKRVSDIQTKLGITREQRAGIMNHIDGNVAQIAADLDEKLQDMPEYMKKEYDEELHYLHRKQQRPPNNVLPPIEKIEAVLEKGDKAEIDNDDVSAIVEEVEQNIDPPKKTDLADGVEV